MAQEVKATVRVGGKEDPSLKSTLTKSRALIAKTIGKAGLGAIVAGGLAMARKAVGDYNAAFRTIRIGTGATGKALDGLMNDVRRVMRGSASEIGDVSTAVADYNTYLGATGDSLQSLSRTALATAKVFGEDVKGLVSASAKAMNAWGISASEGASTMDFLGRTSQATGTSVTELYQGLISGAPALKALGYDAKSAAVLIGSLGKSGVSSERAIKSLTKIARLGGDEWAAYYSDIKGAKTETEAMTIASEIFGRETAPMMAKAIRDGAFSVGDLTSQIDADRTSMESLRKETQSLEDDWMEIKNSVSSMLLPVAKEVMGVIKDTLNWWQSSNGRAVAESILEAVKTFVRIQTWLPRLGAKAVGKAYEKAMEIAGDFTQGQEDEIARRSIQRKALGGHVNGMTLVGEGGPETVISYAPAARAENARYWAEAGQRLGLLGGTSGTQIAMGGLTFAPTIQSASGGSQDLVETLRAQAYDFADAVADAVSGRLARGY